MKFILTKELGRLSRWMRILGFDAAYFNSPKISGLKIVALREERAILTRSQLLKNERHIKTIFLESEDIGAQLKQVVRELNLNLDTLKMFSRCIVCNAPLEEVAKEKIKDKVPEYVYNALNKFNICRQCERVYWQGTHWGNVQKTLEEIQFG